MDDLADTPRHPAPIVFILDCDNTLLDNDGVKADMNERLKDLLGEPLAARFWEVYEFVRQREGTVDLPQTFADFRADAPDDGLMAQVVSAIMDYPFRNRLFPATMQTLGYLREQGLPAIVSDGDSVYQPRKIEQSGLAAAVREQWVVYIHKEDHLEEVMTRWPADYYLMVDDKARILAETKRRFPQRFVTAHLLKGHYADALYTPAPDITLRDIGELQTLDLAALRGYLRS